MNHSRTRNYLAGLVSGYTVTLVTVAVGLWLTPFTLRFLDREEYGIFALSGDVLMWLNLLDLGITASLRMQAAQLTGCSDQERLNCLASTAFFTQLGVMLLMAMVGTGIVVAFPAFFNVRPDIQGQAMQMVGLMVLGTILNMGAQTFSALLVAHQQIHLDNLLRLTTIAIRIVLTVLLLMWGWKLLSLAVASVVAIGCTAVLLVARTMRSFPGLTIHIRLASWETLRLIGSLGFWFSLGGLASILSKSLDRTVAGKLVSLEAVTVMALTSRTYALAGGLLSQITDVARPGLGQLFGKKDLQGALTTYRHLFALSLGGAVVVSLALWAGNTSFVSWWVGGRNYGGWQVDLAFAANLMVQAYLLPHRATLSSALVVRPQTIIGLLEGALNLGLSIFLTLHFGIVGAVISTAIAALLTSMWYIPRLTANLFGLNYSSFMVAEVKKKIVLLLLLFPVAWFARDLGMRYGGLTGACMAIAITVLVGSLILWILVFDRNLKVKLQSIVSISFQNIMQYKVRNSK